MCCDMRLDLRKGDVFQPQTYATMDVKGHSPSLPEGQPPRLIAVP
jgi:hypothetical protein